MAVQIIVRSKPRIRVEAVAGGNLPASTNFFFIGRVADHYSIIASYYGYAPGPTSDQVSCTTTATNKKILMEIYQKGGYISSYSNPGGGLVRATTTVNHGLSNGNVVYLRGTTNYKGYYTISNVTANTFDFTATWAGDDGASNWYNTPGQVQHIDSDSGYLNSFFYKRDYYSMLRADGSKFQWLNTNDPTYSNERYTSTGSYNLYGHRRRGGAYYYGGQYYNSWSTGADGSKYRYLDTVNSAPASDYYWNTTSMYDGGRTSMCGWIYHPEVSLRKWNNPGMTQPLYQLPNGMGEGDSACTIYIDNSNYNNTWYDVINAINNAGVLGKSIIITKNNSSYNISARDGHFIIRGNIFQKNASFATKTIRYDKQITMLQGRLFGHAYGSDFTNKITFNGCNLAFISLCQGYWIEPSFSATNTTATSDQSLYTATLNGGMVGFSPYCWSAVQPTTYQSLTDYNFTGSATNQANNAQAIRYPANGMYIRRMNFTYCFNYITPSVTTPVQMELTDIKFLQPQSDLVNSLNTNIANYDMRIDDNSVIGKTINHIFNCYNVTTPDRADKTIRIKFRQLIMSPRRNSDSVVYFKFHYGASIKVVDSDGSPIGGANVSLSNSAGTPDIYSSTTDVSGNITTQQIYCYKIERDVSNTDGYLQQTYPLGSKTTKFNNISFTITKDGYETYTGYIENMLDAKNLVITLKTAQPIRVTTDGAVLALEPAKGSESLLTNL